MNWISLTSIADLEKAVETSATPLFKSIAIFKHSTHCPVSTIAKKRLVSEWNFGNELPVYYLDLIEYRSVSNQIAEQFNVRHESPQILIIKDGKCIYHASHISISAKEIEKVLNNEK